MGFMLAIVSTGTVILQYAINQLGYLIIAGHTAARKLNSFCSLPLMPLAMAPATFVSQNRGADQRDRILKVVRYAMILSVAGQYLLPLWLHLPHIPDCIALRLILKV